MQSLNNHNAINRSYRVWKITTLTCILLCCFACSRSEQQIKAPDIKIITPENIHGVIATDDAHIWLTGNYGTIFHSADRGKTWAEQNSGEEETILCDGSFINNETGWLVGLNGTILYTEDSGKTWVKQNTGTDKHLFSINFIDKDHGWAAGEWTTVLHTDNGGKTWQRQTKVRDSALNNIVFTNRKNGWVVGERGLILHTDDGGETWTKQTPEVFERETIEDLLENPPPSLFGVFFTDKNNGFACGIEGTIIATKDGGISWNQIPPVTDYTLYTIFIKDKKGWAVGDKGAYLMTEDGGTTWAYDETIIKSKQPFRDIYFTSLKNGWIAGGAGTVIHTIDGGKTWAFRSGLSYAMNFFQMPKGLEFGGGTE